MECRSVQIVYFCGNNKLIANGRIERSACSDAHVCLLLFRGGEVSWAFVRDVQNRPPLVSNFDLWGESGGEGLPLFLDEREAMAGLFIDASVDEEGVDRQLALLERLCNANI